MAKVEPLSALVYNQEKIKDPALVVCPPYDIISSPQQQHYHNNSPYNLIHILLGKDIPGEDKYQRGKGLFTDWQKDKILVQDENPGIYFYSQQYYLKGEKKVRLGFIGRLYLEEKNTGIFGHEHTHLGPKEDRLRLLKKVKANLSPIFVIFSDKKRFIQSTYQQYIQGKLPFVDIVDDEKVSHKLWRLDSKSLLDRLRADMRDETIFIADGHHRYEVACAYRDEMKKKSGGQFQDKGFNYILAYFTNIKSSGLTILPIHRLVKPDSLTKAKDLFKALADYFNAEEVKDKMRLFFLMEKAASGEHVLGMYYEKRQWLLRLKNVGILDKLIYDKPPEYRALDVAILNYIVFKKILGLDLENKESILFSHNANELIEKADNDNSYIAFFLNPVKAQQIISIALRQEKMPPKSTYFYPKVLSGLVISKFDG